MIAVFSGVLPSTWQILMWALPLRERLRHFTHCLPWETKQATT